MHFETRGGPASPLLPHRRLRELGCLLRRRLHRSSGRGLLQGAPPAPSTDDYSYQYVAVEKAVEKAVETAAEVYNELVEAASMKDATAKTETDAPEARAEEAKPKTSPLKNMALVAALMLSALALVKALFFSAAKAQASPGVGIKESLVDEEDAISVSASSK